MEKQPTAQQLLDAITKWQGQLCDDPKVSQTKFSHMQTALYGAKMIIRDLYGLPRVSENAMVK